MATLSIEGRKVRVDDSFRQMTPEQQNQAVEEIAASLGITAQQQPELSSEPAARPAPGSQGQAAAPEGLQPGTREYADWAAQQARAGKTLPQVSDPEFTETQSSVMDPLIQGATFGWGDEVASAMHGVEAVLKGDDFGNAYSQAMDHYGNALEHERRVNPVGSFAAEVAGALPTAAVAGGQLAARGATAGARAVSGALVGAGQGAVYGAGSSDGDVAERGKNAFTSALLGAGIGAAVPFVGQAARRMASPVPASAANTAAAKKLAAEGVELTAGQRTGSKALQYAESELGGPRAADFLERQGEQFTEAVLKRAGISAKRATPEVLDNTFDTLGNRFDRMAALTQTRFDARLRTELLDIVDDYLNTSGMPAPGIQNMAERVAQLAQANRGVLTGRIYQNLRSKLGQMMRAADGPTRVALQDLRNALDDALERSNSGRTLELWQNLRRRWQNLLVIEKAATGAGANTASGLISPAQLRHAAIGQNRRAFARGNNEFAELANAGVQAMTPLPQSGTAPRLAARQIPTIVGAAAGAPGGVPGAILGAVAGAAAPAMMGRAILSGPGVGSCPIRWRQGRRRDQLRRSCAVSTFRCWRLVVGNARKPETREDQNQRKPENCAEKDEPPSFSAPKAVNKRAQQTHCDGDHQPPPAHGPQLVRAGMLSGLKVNLRHARLIAHAGPSEKSALGFETDAGSFGGRSSIDVCTLVSSSTG